MKDDDMIPDDPTQEQIDAGFAAAERDREAADAEAQQPRPEPVH